jgi:hypothetical protein
VANGLKKCGDCGRTGLRPDGECLYSFSHWKSRSGPRERQGQTKAQAGSTKRCPFCREHGGCYISVCACDCHTGQLVSPTLRAPLATRRFGRAAHEPHGHSH